MGMARWWIIPSLEMGGVRLSRHSIRSNNPNAEKRRQNGIKLPAANSGVLLNALNAPRGWVLNPGFATIFEKDLVLESDAMRRFQSVKRKKNR
ncbi:MAG: hypothetical protein KKA41_03105 [Proteobacteria bacterium]|nr:hypothetical protein [Pseudomonadota bacterium]